MMNSTVYRAAVCVAAIELLLASIAGASAQTTVKIGLAVPNYGPFAPIYAADELGYFRDAGLKPEITAYRGGPAAQEALAAGAADIINFFPPGVALAVKKGIKEKVVGLGSAKPGGGHLMGSAVRTLAVGPPAQIPPLKSIQIDAAVLNPPIPFRLIVPGEGRSLVDLAKEMEPTLPDVGVATQSLIDSNPKVVEGTLHAIYKATAYMKKNPAYGRD